jgi:hypothetical protein
MHPISIKAVVVSNAVQLGMVLAVLIVAVLATLTVAWVLAGFPTDIGPITDEFKASSLLVSSTGAISVMSSSLTAGYVAGRIAGRRPVLHGALSSCAWFILLMCIALGGTRSHEPAHGGAGAGPLVPALLGAMLFLNLTAWRSRRLYCATEGPRPRAAGDRAFAIFKVVVAWLFQRAELDRREAQGTNRDGDDVVGQLHCCDAGCEHGVRLAWHRTTQGSFHICRALPHFRLLCCATCRNRALARLGPESRRKSPAALIGHQ